MIRLGELGGLLDPYLHMLVLGNGLAQLLRRRSGKDLRHFQRISLEGHPLWETPFRRSIFHTLRPCPHLFH